MATKCITITEQAYANLAREKEFNDSFSDVIMRLTKKNSALALVGLLSGKEAEELRKNIKRFRKGIDKEIGQRGRRLE